MQTNKMNATPVTSHSPHSRLWLIAGLILLSTFLFVIGTSLERRQHEANEATGTHEETEEVEETHPEGTTEETEEAFLGINFENPWLVAAAVVTSLLLAAALFRWRQPALLLIVLMMGAMTLLDIREVLFQIGQAQMGIALIAGAVALTHGGAALLSGLTLWQRQIRYSAT